MDWRIYVSYRCQYMGMMQMVIVLTRASLLSWQVDIRIRVKGGGFTSQLYAIRQAIAKGIVAYTQKCKCSWV